MNKHLTVSDAEAIDLVLAMTTISDFCDRCLDCLGCPFFKDFGKGENECLIETELPYYWRERFKDGH